MPKSFFCHAKTIHFIPNTKKKKKKKKKKKRRKEENADPPWRGDSQVVSIQQGLYSLPLNKNLCAELYRAYSYSLYWDENLILRYWWHTAVNRYDFLQKID